MREYTIKMKLENINDIINNNRINRYYGAKKKKEEMQSIAEFIHDTTPIEKYPLKIVCKWYIKNTNSDLDNKSIKAVLDELQVLGVLKNDNIKHITTIEHRAIKSDEDKLELIIKEVEDNE